MIALAVMLAVGSGIVGLYISYWQNAPTGPTIVLVSGAAFGSALLFAPAQGLVWNFVRQRRLRNLPQP
jgi:ABC-type Mn2+/Zn2+ transport system permease subunit